MITSVLSCINQASKEIGISRGLQSAVQSLDQNIIQMVALMNVVAGECLKSEPYRTTIGDGVWIIDAVAHTPKYAATQDSDLIVIDDRIMIDGLKYRFLKAKGFEYGEELRDFLEGLNKAAAAANAELVDLDIDGGDTVQ